MEDKNNVIIYGGNGAMATNEQRDRQKWLVRVGLAILALIALLWWAPWANEPRGIVTIGEGRGLQQHVTYSEAIDIAEQNGLPVMVSPMGQGPYAASYAEARALESQVASVKVDVVVYPGDQINLDTGEYIPGPTARQLGRR